MDAQCVTVVGGANTDICGAPAGCLVRHDSNPGRVTLRHGGVGRNIACDLALLGLKVRFLGAIGEDALGLSVRDGLRAYGVDCSLSRIVKGERSSVYLYVTDERGEMDVGVADMDVTAQITPAWLRGRLDALNASDAVLLDGNLSAETIEWLAAHVRVPLYADPVSTAKAPRLLRALDRLTAIKPNLLEARALTGRGTPEDCAEALLAAGVKRVYISLGKDGLLAAEGEERILLPRIAAELVNTNGAGDAATAAVIWAELHGLGLAGAAAAAVRAGTLTVASEETNSPLLKPEALLGE